MTFKIHMHNYLRFKYYSISSFLFGRSNNITKNDVAFKFDSLILGTHNRKEAGDFSFK